MGNFVLGLFFGLFMILFDALVTKFGLTLSFAYSRLYSSEDLGFLAKIFYIFFRKFNTLLLLFFGLLIEW